MNVLVTGGAGFIGSNIVDRLMKDGNNVKVVDNFSTGKEEFISQHFNKANFELVKMDLNEVVKLEKVMTGTEFVFHLAGHADVKSGLNDHEIDHEQNLNMTRNILEAIYKNEVKGLMFASTSSVYGDATIHPTPEDYPFEPTSLYGASKAAAESYIRAYASYYGFRSFIYRFVSFTGERYTHGIVFDVLKKIKSGQKEIELFSDGSPKKSSVYVKDGIEAIFKVIKESKEQFNVYNIGHDEVITVDEIVDHIFRASGAKGLSKKWLGKTSNWKGDNEFVHLDNQKLKGLGWKPLKSIGEGVELTAKYILDNLLK
jgi:UDP-glucose 4-epimerase